MPKRKEPPALFPSTLTLVANQCPIAVVVLSGIKQLHLWLFAGNTQAVLVHQLSKHTTQNPFRKNRGRVVRVLFHPLKPFLFVATQNHVRVYNLAQQALAKKLIGGSGSITSMAIHPGGDHVIIGSEVSFCLQASTTLRCLLWPCKPVVYSMHV